MQEDFLYYLWRQGKFEKELLSTTNGEQVEIIHPGYRNDDSGPDFFNARIRIGNFLWAGNVEIHVKSSDWFRHGHTYDQAFDNIILHVVHEEDAKIKRADQSEIPTITLKGKYSLNCWEQYVDLIQGASTNIPCEKEIARVPVIIKQQTIDRMLVERLEDRSKIIAGLLTQTNNNWEESFYRHLAKSFGFRVNNVPFELLSSSLPLSIINKHRDQLIQVEALLFGQAGFLTGKFNDDYRNLLKREFNHLKLKFSLQPMQPHLWKFGRLRPANFPTIRLAQFAMLYHHHDRLFNNLLSVTSLNDVIKIVDVSTSVFWDSHYSFTAKSPVQIKRLGRSSIESVVINTVAPFLFFYGQYHHSQDHKEKAISLLEQCDFENHRITRTWQELGWEVHAASCSQGLLQLKKYYCDTKNCVNCGIGQFLLKSI